MGGGRGEGGGGGRGGCIGIDPPLPYLTCRNFPNIFQSYKALVPQYTTSVSVTHIPCLIPSWLLRVLVSGSMTDVKGTL